MSQRRQLTHIFGGIDHDVEHAFFSLPPHELEALFLEYRSRYGRQAESYARRTYPLWSNGTTKLSGQTAERLLQLLPPRLSPDFRYNLISKLRNHYRKRVRVHVTTTAELWRQHVIPALEKVIAASSIDALPKQLYEKATWLTHGSTEAAYRILHSIDEEEARQRTAYLDAEFRRIDLFVASVKNTKAASHTISIPQGEVCVTIQIRRPTLLQFLFGKGRTIMSGDKHELALREQMEQALAAQQSRGNLLNLTLNDLSEQQQIELRRKIVEERIGLDVSQARADQRFYNSTRDMANTVHVVRGLEQSSKSDYQVDSQFETSSGSTQITVKKNNNTVIMIVAIVVGIVVFFLMSR